MDTRFRRIRENRLKEKDNGEPSPLPAFSESVFQKTNETLALKL